jgi:hypothetical protein
LCSFSSSDRLGLAALPAAAKVGAVWDDDDERDTGTARPVMILAAAARL